MTPWTVAHSCSWQEYWSRQPFFSPEDLPNPGVEPGSPTLHAYSLLSEPLGKQRSHKVLLAGNEPVTSIAATAAAKSLQLCPTLCDPMDGSPPGSPIPGILQAREWRISGVGCHFLLQCMKVESESEVAQSCLTLRDPMDCSLPGSSSHGIFQARILEWIVIAFSESC